MDPVSDLVGLLDSESEGNPENDVVVRPSSLGEFEHPLITKGRTAACCNNANALNVVRDLLRRPKPVPTVREGDKDCLVASSSSFENRSC